MKIHVFTDGAAKGNPGPGGYGIVMQIENTEYYKEFSEGFKLTTNNRMELLGVIVALEKLTKINLNVTVWSDSKYVVDSVNKGWLFNWEKKAFAKKKNADLWIRFLKIYRLQKVKFIWIKGHNNQPQNERCDQLAVEAATQLKLKTDVGYKPETKKP